MMELRWHLRVCFVRMRFWLVSVAFSCSEHTSFLNRYHHLISLTPTRKHRLPKPPARLLLLPRRPANPPQLRPPQRRILELPPRTHHRRPDRKTALEDRPVERLDAPSSGGRRLVQPDQPATRQGDQHVPGGGHANCQLHGVEIVEGPSRRVAEKPPGILPTHFAQ